MIYLLAGVTITVDRPGKGSRTSMETPQTIIRRLTELDRYAFPQTDRQFGMQQASVSLERGLWFWRFH